MALRAATVRVTLDPALARASRRSKRSLKADREKLHRLFWQHFDLEKLARLDTHFRRLDRSSG